MNETCNFFKLACRVSIADDLCNRARRGHRLHPLTSFSPQILLMMELEAGLAEGPRTATTPLDIIWHTAKKNKQRGEFNSEESQPSQSRRRLRAEVLLKAFRLSSPVALIQPSALRVRDMVVMLKTYKRPSAVTL